MQEARENDERADERCDQRGRACVQARRTGRMEYVIAGETNLMGAGELRRWTNCAGCSKRSTRSATSSICSTTSLRAEGVQIFIGQESGYRILDDVSMVTASLQRRQRSGGCDQRHRADAHGIRARDSHRRRHRENSRRRARARALGVVHSGPGYRHGLFGALSPVLNNCRRVPTMPAVGLGRTSSSS